MGNPQIILWIKHNYSHRGKKIKRSNFFSKITPFSQKVSYRVKIAVLGLFAADFITPFFKKMK